MTQIHYLIVDIPMTADQQEAATNFGITDPRVPIDGTQKAIVGFETVPIYFSDIQTYTRKELLPITMAKPWRDTDKFPI